ncbi:MAG TPA: peptide chain release factor N(5)-glutamine methyltransferase [Burkholderiales bacterium]
MTARRPASMEFDQPVTLAAAVDAAARALRPSSPTARLDAEVLLRHASGLTLADAVAQPRRPLSDAIRAAFTALIERRRQGEPIAYITGRREFWSLDLAVSPATLIPRPETELLVEQALARIPADAPSRIVDLGTGCGAIALAIASERPRARVMATDISEAALAVARANAARLGISNVEFRFGDWFVPLRTERFDVVVSNPPYVVPEDPHLREGDLRFEPCVALVADGPDGLDAIRAIASTARANLVPGGWLLLEHGLDQAPDVHGILARAGYVEIRSYKDLAGHDRTAIARSR